MMIARFIKRVSVRQRLYQVTPPIEGASYVLASRCQQQMENIQGCSEVYLFASTEQGNVTDWIELNGSQRGTSDIEKPLRDLGYKIVK